MPQGVEKYAEVAVPLPVFGTFTYSIPPELVDAVRLGTRVEVPWRSKLTTAFVLGLNDTIDFEVSRVRPIRSVLDLDEPAITPDMIELCRWAASYYIAPIGEMFRVALPANMSVRGKRQIAIIGSPLLIEESLSSGGILKGDADLLREITGSPADFDNLARSHRGARSAFERLSKAGIVSISERLRDASGVRFDRYVVLIDPSLETNRENQEVLLQTLRRLEGEAPVAALVNSGISESTISTVAKKGGVRVERRPRTHTLDPFLASLDTHRIGDLRHTPEQRTAIDTVQRRLGEFAPFLLQGVTGSGKTEVYIELMREVVKRGGQAILLVPEISLTPVLGTRLKERFGDRIAILHSNLSPSERYDQWWRARRGEVDVAIGPRSALFTPFERPGLIIVDEEGDGAYKQEESPRYNARDLAVVRARIHGIPIVLGSATPSLESRENAARGRYQLLRLERRVEERPLPIVEIIDIRKERGEKEDRGLVIFSSALRVELGEVFAREEQSIILINRRGYAPFLLCRECENDFRCRDCSVTMTVHRRMGLLVCHYCGRRQSIPAKCPLCGGEVLQPIGFGTEKVEERFRLYFPDIAVEVLDRDTTRKKGELVRILDRFRRGATQALIGTQMISKGHDFPKVTLTAVITADSILGFPDFRSAEKTFYLLTQVAGRAGRGDRLGRVLIQSAFPHHYALQHAIHHDYEAFFEAEMEFRRRFLYPPASTMIAILVRGERVEKVESAATALGQSIERAAGDVKDIRIQGPAPAPISRIKGVYRFQILVRSADRSGLRKAVERTVAGRDFGGVDVVIDVDPINIL